MQDEAYRRGIWECHYSGDIWDCRNRRICRAAVICDIFLREVDRMKEIIEEYGPAILGGITGIIMIKICLSFFGQGGALTMVVQQYLAEICG